jgi:peptide/nickel transport system permease protein
MMAAESSYSRFTLSAAQRERIVDLAVRVRRNSKAYLGLMIVLSVILVATVAPFVAPYEKNATDLTARTESPSAAHPFGTDELGRDVFSRVILGTRISLYVGILSILIALLAGMTIGVVAGYYGGWVDELLMRVMDAAMSFPPILLALAIMVVLGPQLSNVVIALGFVYTPYIARVGRSAALTERNQEYVESAIARGESHPYIVFREVLPNCMAPVFIQASINVAFAMLSEAALSFLGMGAQPPTPSWGLMIDAGRGFIETAPWMILAPGFAIAYTVIGFNLLGDGLRDVLDPKVEMVET